MSQTATKTAAQIRQEFLDFFAEKHGHTVVPSSPVVPHDDPTLLFANAGMNQFKDVFLGRSDLGFTRAVDTQKCIRAGGKHNDLEDVGKDGYHHTFFEMLGNWSFGDYFKAEAIEWAWDLLVNIWGLNPERLYATVFEGDASEGTEPDVEAEDLWKRYLPAERISRWGKKDNFWEMGATGPCGPCSEVHYDGRSDEEINRVGAPTGAELVNRDHEDVIEIWNLVFIQFNRAPGSDGEPGVLTPLPAKHVDTGMGFERIVRAIQGKQSNYDIDVWTDLFDAIREQTGAEPYQGRTNHDVDMAYRVIADHVRCLTVAIADGGMPGNEGRDYVLRSILRRAVRHARQTLNVEGPVLYKLVPAVIQTLGDAYPELKKNPERIADVIRNEEESFLRTLDRGLELFDIAAKHASEKSAPISADDAFKLHDTYGFPIGLTRIMAEERGMTVDEDGFEKLMGEARSRSRKTGGPEEGMILPPDAIAGLEKRGVQPTRDDHKYDGRPISTVVRAIWDGSTFDASASTGEHVALILDRTNFYAEAGGQVGDTGRIRGDVPVGGAAPMRGYAGSELVGDSRFEVEDTQSFGGYILHIGRVVEGKVREGDNVNATVNLEKREQIMANHTATHLLNLALREVLGDDVHQRGSLVAPDRLRFDFTCPRSMKDEEVEQVQKLVRDGIVKKLGVFAEDVPLTLAKQINGVRAVFGERYPDPVRVVSIGNPILSLIENLDNPEWAKTSIEFCGGTHMESVDHIGSFAITHESALAAGVRRITALTGVPAKAAVMAGNGLESRTRDALELGGDELAGLFEGLSDELAHLTLSAPARHRITPMMDDLRAKVKAIKREQKSAARGGVVEQARTIAEEQSGELILAALHGADKNTLMSALDAIRAKHVEAAIMLFAPDEEEHKVAIVASVPKPLIGKGLKAGDWVRLAATECGGGGGGRPDMAQAGGKDPAKVPEAMQAARTFADGIIG